MGENVQNINADLKKILTRERRNRCYLISILQDIQASRGFLSGEDMREVAKFLGMPASAVWGVATFYNQFRFTPPGRRPVRVCMGTACHLGGGQLVLEAMARELEIEIGGTTADREFSLERVACIGCCALAPVATIGPDVYPRLTPPKVEEIVVEIKADSTAQDVAGSGQ